jgi:hypothetical protein
MELVIIQVLVLPDVFAPHKCSFCNLRMRDLESLASTLEFGGEELTQVSSLSG